MNSLKYLEEPKYWLLGITAGLIAIHLTLTSRSDNIDVLGSSFLFWGAASLLLWDKRDSLNLQSDVISSFFGTAIVALILGKSASVSGYDIFLRLSPLLCGIGLALIASGIKGLKQYWQELTILSCTAVSTGLLLRFYNISPLTAKFAAFVLWYGGLPVSHKGIYLHLPTGSVEVYSGCSGYSLMIQLMGLALVFLFMFPTTWKQKILLPSIAILIGFIVNGLRVALMAFLVAYSNQKAFEYWHYGDGSLLFSMFGVLVLGLFCWFFILRDDTHNQKANKC